MFRSNLTRISAWLVVFWIAPGVALAQPSSQARIERALSAAPASVADGATVMEADGTILRRGTNGWTCLPALGAEHPACLDAVWMEFVKALMGGTPFSTKRVGLSYMLQPEVAPTNNHDPADTTQDPGEVWVQEGPHLMLILPDKAQLEGMPTDPNNGGPYVMWKGTPYAHVMVPLGPRP